MTEITIRTASTEDREILSALIAAAYGKLAEGGHYDQRSLGVALPAMSRANPKLLESGSYYIAEIDGRAAGCGGWTREAPGTGEVVDGVGHIRHFATHPDFLRRGVARRLLDHCLAQAATQGVRLMKSNSTLPAQAFYAAAGFVRVREIEVEMAPGAHLPAIEMERKLR